MRSVLVINRLHVSGRVVKRLIPIHESVRWVEYEKERNEIRIKYLNDTEDVYGFYKKDDETVKIAFERLVANAEERPYISE